MRKEQDRITKERRHTPYKADEQVWLEGTNLKLPYDNRKLSPKRYGPFRVAAKILETSYQLDLPQSWKIHPVFHATLLTPYKETEVHGPNFIEPPPEIIEGEPEWEVEKILSERRYRNKKQYLIRGKNYSPAHDSWTDIADISAPDAIKQYHESHQNLSQHTTRTTKQKGGKATPRAYIRTTYVAEEKTTTSLPTSMSSVPINGATNATSVTSQSSLSPSYVPATPSRRGSPTTSYHSPLVVPGRPIGTPRPRVLSLADRISDVPIHPNDYALGSLGELEDTWNLCRAALHCFRATQELPDSIRAFAAQVFSMATDPEPPTDIQSRYREVDDYSLVVKTLCAYREELDEYILADRNLLSSATPEPQPQQESEAERQEDEEQGESTRGLSPT